MTGIPFLDLTRRLITRAFSFVASASPILITGATRRRAHGDRPGVS
jgi:hypothetical protein